MLVQGQEISLSLPKMLLFRFLQKLRQMRYNIFSSFISMHYCKIKLFALWHRNRVDIVGLVTKMKKYFVMVQCGSMIFLPSTLSRRATAGRLILLTLRLSQCYIFPLYG
jgi:hypothetical protein